ncbi:GNAT family N-acetyltransferase [Promicromonospora sp. NPDC023987]|uniref:GNAT family N-acetyltransferase n=1 Tax=Promicromonospora sp. NPDC023987 TaxID=3155360 RepID=UPI0033FBD8FF
MITDAVTLAVGGAPPAAALVLRPWTDDDVDVLLAAYQDPAMRRWSAAVPQDRRAGRAWIKGHQDGWSDGHQFAFAVLEDAPGAAPRLAGHVVLREVTPGEPAAEVGYWTVADARGRGVAHRALEALTTWAFDTFGPDGLQRLRLLHQVDNVASCRVAEKTGYVLDAVLAPWPPVYPLEGHVHVRAR